MIVLLLIAQAVLVVAGLTGIRQTHRRIDLTNPMVILLVLWIFLYTLQLIPTWDGTDVFSHVVAPWIAGNRAGQLRAAYVETAALAVMIVMYFAAGSLRFETTRASRVGPRYPINRARVVAVLGFILFVLLVISSHGLHALAFGIYNRTQFFSGKNYLALGPTIISTAGIATIIADGVWPPKRHGIVLFVTGELFGLFTGSKSSLAVPLITLAAVIYFLWRRFRLVTVVIAIAVVLASLTTYDLYFRNALPRQIPLTQAFDQLGGWSGVTNIFVGDALFAHQAMTIAVVEFRTGPPVSRSRRAWIAPPGASAPLPRPQQGFGALGGLHPDVRPAGTLLGDVHSPDRAWRDVHGFRIPGSAPRVWNPGGRAQTHLRPTFSIERLAVHRLPHMRTHRSLPPRRDLRRRDPLSVVADPWSLHSSPSADAAAAWLKNLNPGVQRPCPSTLCQP